MVSARTAHQEMEFMKTPYLAVIFGVLIASGCANSPSKTQLPTSAMFERVQIDRVASAFALACPAIGGRMISQTTNMIECAKPMGDSLKETSYRMLATTDGSADFHLQWTFMQSADGIDVVVNCNEWIEHQNAFGKTTRDAVSFGEAAKVMNDVHGLYIKQRAKTAAN